MSENQQRFDMTISKLHPGHDAVRAIVDGQMLSGVFGGVFNNVAEVKSVLTLHVSGDIVDPAKAETVLENAKARGACVSVYTPKV